MAQVYDGDVILFNFEELFTFLKHFLVGVLFLKLIMEGLKYIFNDDAMELDGSDVIMTIDGSGDVRRT